MAASAKYRKRKRGQCCAGHDVQDAGNLYIRSDGYTECRICKRQAARRLRFDGMLRELLAVRKGAIEHGTQAMVAEIDGRIRAVRARMNGASEDECLEIELASKVAGETAPAYVKRR